MGKQEEVIKSERDIIQAMLTSDVKELDRLISDQLVFFDHFGHRFSKIEDLDAHRSGKIRIESIEVSDQIIKVYNHIAVVFVLLKIKGEFFGNLSEGSFRFCRVWTKDDNVWKITAGQSTLVH